MSSENKIPIKRVEIKDKRATYDKEQGKIVCGNLYDLEFDFDEEWDGYDDKKAKIKFYHQGIHKSLTIEFKGNVCTIPKLYNIPRIEVGVFIEDGICTTTGAIIECDKSINCGASKSVLGADAIDNINKALSGKDGLSAFEIFKKYHPEYTGTEEEWLKSLGGNGVSGDFAPLVGGKVPAEYLPPPDVDKAYVDGLIGDISSALDELHAYAQALANGGNA